MSRWNPSFQLSYDQAVPSSFIQEKAKALYVGAREQLVEHPLQTGLLLTVLLALLHGYTVSVFSPLLSIAALSMVLFPVLMRHPLPWILLSAAAFVAVYQNLYLEDNHKFLLAYWLFAVFLTTLVKAENRRGFLIGHARFFLIFVFGAAAIQKSIDPTYVSSEFFAFTLLTDQRFELFMMLLGVSGEELAASREAKMVLEQSYLNDMATNAVMLANSQRINLIAFLVTWWDLLVQVVIAVMFAINRRTTDIIGHVCLMAFILSTYFFAPVIGFGWTITIWAFLVSCRRFPNLAMTYIAVLPLLSIYQLPWGSFLTRLFA